VAALLRGKETSVRGKALLIAGLLVAGSAIADDDESQYARGHVDIQFSLGTTVVDTYRFVAHRKSDGTFGNFKFESKYSGLEVEASGEVICLTVIGNQARVGGQVTRSDFEGIPVGSQLTWSITSNDGKKNDGSDEDDTASSLLGADAIAYCAGGLPYPEFPVRKGDVEVRP
jgi:hypothetical protein